MIPPKTHAEYLERARQLEQAVDRPGFKLGILSSFTADFLKPYLVVESARFGCLLRPWIAPFNQFEQMVMDASSPLWQGKPDILWLAMRPEDLDRHLIHEFPALKPDLARSRISVFRERLVALARAARERFSGPILVSNLTLLDQGLLDIFDAGNAAGLAWLLTEENRLLVHELGGLPDVHIFDYAGAVSAFGGERWKDQRLWHMARAASGQEAQKSLATRLARTAAAVLRPPAKCLVLDLDNTLWGGVLGDDGPQGIVIGDDYPGSVYKDFQAALLGYRNRGFLLAIASKNDEGLVRATLDTHPEMILRTRHFADIRANWEPKTVNIPQIAAKLNIGLNSLLFVDDNPLERVHVRSELPAVQVIELPPDPLGFAGALAECGAFDRPRLLREDAMRAEMYAQDNRRVELGAAVADVGQFLIELKMGAEVGLLDANTSERIHQLIHKTNQFNLTTRRHPMGELERLTQSDDSRVAWLRLTDRFGELGLVCVGIVRKADACVWEIDTLLMSCRVMGRNVEDAFLAYLGELALSRGASRLRGIYIKTPKNSPVENFFRDRNFTEIKRPNDSTRVYEIELRPTTLTWPAHIKRGAEAE